MTVLPFPTWVPFTFFPCLIAEDRTCNTVLNRSGESGHPCLVPELGGTALSFSEWFIVSFKTCVALLMIFFACMVCPQMPVVCSSFLSLSLSLFMSVSICFIYLSVPVLGAYMLNEYNILFLYPSLFCYIMLSFVIAFVFSDLV